MVIVEDLNLDLTLTDDELVAQLVDAYGWRPERAVVVVAQVRGELLPPL